MVDVGRKPVTARAARASGRIAMSAEAFRALRGRTVAKGDALALARAAGIAAAKRTSEWIPLCHIVPLDQVAIDIAFEPLAIRVEARVSARWTTGVEMEALVAVSAALLTLYDMTKALDRGMVLGPIRLEQKSGGRSGPYRRSAGGAPRSAPSARGRRTR